MQVINRKDLYKLEAVEVYKLVLDGTLGKFPNGFWYEERGLDNSLKCLRYLIEDLLNFNSDDIKNNLSQKFFQRYKLKGMCALVFNGSPYKAINSLYPDRFKPWDMPMCPIGYWNNIDNCINATKWLLEEHLKWTDDEILSNLSGTIFINNGLGGMITKYNDSLFTVYNLAYPNKYKPWQFKQAPTKYWTSKENRDHALKWLFEEVLNWTDEELKEKYDANIFIDNHLFGLLKNYFNGSPYDALNYYYPNKFKAWELKQTPRKYWELKENRINALKWLIEKNSNWTEDELLKNWNRELLIDNNLSSLIQYHNGNCFKVLDELYPDKYNSWTVRSVQDGHWHDANNRIEAIRWLIEKKLQYNDDEILEKLSEIHFFENRLSGLLANHYKSNAFWAVNELYPNKFNPWEFNNISVPKRYWELKDHRIKALKWLFEDKLNWNKHDILNKWDYSILADNNLNGLLYFYKNSNYKPLTELYPNL